MIDVPVRLHRQVPISSCPQKPWRFFKLQFIDTVVDISVDMQRSVQTVLKTVEGAQVQHDHKFVGVRFEMYRKFSKMRTVQKAEEESYSIL